MRLFFVLSLCTLFFFNGTASYAQDATNNALPNVEKPSSEETARENIFARASDAQIEEAQKYYRSCKNNDVMSERKDCKCAATRYLETRLNLGNSAPIDQIISENLNTCLKNEDQAVNANPDNIDLEVTEKQREEAEHIYKYCQSNPQLKIEADCECVAANYLQERITSDPIRTKDDIMGSILIQGKCKNIVDSTGQQYSGCMAGSGYDTPGIDRKKYCECYARSWAKSLEQHQGKLGPATKNSMKLRAMMTCRKEAKK